VAKKARWAMVSLLLLGATCLLGGFIGGGLLAVRYSAKLCNRQSQEFTDEVGKEWAKAAKISSGNIIKHLLDEGIIKPKEAYDAQT